MMRGVDTILRGEGGYRLKLAFVGVSLWPVESYTGFRLRPGNDQPALTYGRWNDTPALHQFTVE